MKIEYVVGQRVYLLGNDRHMPTGYVEVSKIGTKWISLSNGYRIAKKSSCSDSRSYDTASDVDGCWSSKVFPGKQYADDYEESERLRAECRDMLQTAKPLDLGLATWRMIHRILKDSKCS